MTDSKALIERLQNNAVPVEPNHVIVERPKVIQVIDHIKKLEADNARLREALEGVVAFGERHPGHGYSCATIARAALQETSHDA